MQNMNSSLDAKFSPNMDRGSLTGTGENPNPVSQENCDFSIFSTLENKSSQPLFPTKFIAIRTGKQSLPEFSRSGGPKIAGQPSTLIKEGINQNLGYPKENLFQYSSIQGFTLVNEEPETQEKNEIFEKSNVHPHASAIWGSTRQVAETISIRPEALRVEPKRPDDLKVFKIASHQSGVLFQSKNLLSFLFWVFFYDSQANGESIFKKKSKKGKMVRWIGIALRGGLSFKTFLKPGNFLFKTKLKPKKKQEKFIGSTQKNGVPNFAVFLLLSLVYLGFKGSKSKFFVYQERILTLSHQKAKTTQVLGSLQTGGINGAESSDRLLSSAVGLTISKRQKPKTRFFAYSPLDTNFVCDPETSGPRQTFENLDGLNMVTFDGSRSDPLLKKGTLFAVEGRDYFLRQLAVLPTGFLANTHFSGDSILRSFICIASQYFVFSFITKFISENHLGRSNPLRQKDFQNNQTRIFWPNKRKFFILKRNELKKELLTLPGTQEIWPLIEVLIQSLNQRASLGNELRLSTKTFGPWSAGAINSSALTLTKPPSFSLSPPKGYLFVGPPGTGKTLLAREIAQLSNVPFLCVSASEIQKQIEIGTRIGALRLRKVFEEAHALSPCILFFDEIDAIAQRQSQHDSKLFTEFLIQMDSWGGPKGARPTASGRISRTRNGVSSPRGLAQQKPSLRKDGKLKTKLFSINLFGSSELRYSSVILGTTNYLERLDSAFVRSGRFDRIVALSYPSKNIRFEILTFYLNKEGQPDVSRQGLFAPNPRGMDLHPTNLPEAFGSKTFAKENFKVRTKSKVFLGQTLGLNYFSVITEGFSQAHLAKLVNESLLFSISLKASAEEAKQPQDKKNEKLFSFQKTTVIDHSFFTLLYGLKQMLIHRKNLPH